MKIKKQRFRDLLGLHHQGVRGELPYVADYTRLSNRCFFPLLYYWYSTKFVLKVKMS
jgi:hypothetical protein